MTKEKYRKTYINKSDNSYIFEYEELSDLIENKFELKNAVSIKKNEKFVLPEEINFMAIKEDDIELFKANSNKYLEQGIDELMNYLNNFEFNNNIELIKKEKFIEVSFNFKGSEINETIIPGKTTKIEKIENNDYTLSELNTIEKIKKNIFFKNLCSDLDSIELVNCPNKDERFFLIPTESTKLLYSPKLINEKLEKYKEEEIFFDRKKEDDFVLEI